VAVGYYVRCDEVVELVSDYLEQALNPVDTEAIEQHVVICAACADYVAQLRGTLAAAGTLRDESELDDAAFEPLLRLFRHSTQREEP
jgi:predicted anti-sigma-YlaC factor YlaD